MSPVGATLLGNVVAIGMIMLYRRRKSRGGVNLPGRSEVIIAAA